MGGQFTSQAVPPDEHRWVESFGRTRRYAELRRRVRERYARSGAVRPGIDLATLNPGGGWVSRLCALPSDWLAALGEMGLPGRGIDVRLRTVAVEAVVHEDRVVAVRLLSHDTGREEWVEPRLVLESTETGEVLALAGAEYRLGAESRSETGEPHAIDGPGEVENVQSFTWCALVSHDPVGDHTIPEPADYRFWRDYQPLHWPGPLLSLSYLHALSGEARTLPLFGPEPLSWFDYRKVVSADVLVGPIEEATVVNWPQNDYALGRVVGVDAESAARRLESARQLTLSLVYWLQTECGAPGLRLRPDLAGTADGLAMAPYHREGRRMEAVSLLREQDVARALNPGRGRAPQRADSVAVGWYPIDVHPSANGAPTFDLETLPFQIPAGCLVPVRLRNLIGAGKAIGVTHVTNGCTRLHPVEWGVGEAAGLMAAVSLETGMEPAEMVAGAGLAGLQGALEAEGAETAWPAWLDEDR